MEEPTSKVKSLAKALRVLECFANDRYYQYLLKRFGL